MKQLVGIALAIIFWGIIVSCALLNSSRAEDRLGYGQDVKHNKDVKSFVIDVKNFTFMTWDHNYAVGYYGETSYNKGGITFGFGAIQVHETEKAVGTNLNFLLSAGYCWTDYCIMARHISHGAFIGIADDKPNAGLNVLTFMIRFN